MANAERLLDFVPRIYSALLPEVFERPFEPERRATCSDCAMCKPADAVFTNEFYYSPSVKCCTYHPGLPNYLIGGLLTGADPADAEGARRIRERIARRHGVTPAGIRPGEKQVALYQLGAKKGFGRALSLTCPYLDTARGACTVWSHRGAVCASWFCKYDAGQDGRVFWDQVRDYLRQVELLLAVHALRELGWDACELVDRTLVRPKLDANELDELPPDPATYEKLWRQWVGREETLFVACHDIVRGLDRERFAEIGGLTLQLHGELLAARLDEVQVPTLPDPLCKNPDMRARRGGDGTYLVSTYSGTDINRLRAPVYELLEYFDGRTPTETVLTNIRNQTGKVLSAPLLKRLYQHRLLVAPA